MAEPHSTIAVPPSSAVNGEVSPLQENAENGVVQPVSIRRTRCFAFIISFWILAFIISFWILVSVLMILVLKMFASWDFFVVLSPDSSIVYQPSPIFVKYVEVENLRAKPGSAFLYGTYEYPSLDVVDIWKETRNVSLPSRSRKEWKYYLNRGSEVKISYRLTSETSSIYLVIDKVNEGRGTTILSMNMTHGIGMITQKIFTSSSYYVALVNWQEEVQVELNVSALTSLHNTDNAYYECPLSRSPWSPCRLNIFFPGNKAVLVTPGPKRVQTSNDDWYFKLNYGPRWLTFIFGIGGMTLLLICFLNSIANEDIVRDRRTAGTSAVRVPFLATG